MKRSILFLLPPGFIDNGRREYCPECAEAWGVLHYFPAIRETLDIRYETIAHPREGVASLLGEGRWNCPTLVFSDDAPATDHPAVKSANGRFYIDSARGIGRYFAEVHGIPVPRGAQ